MNPFVDAIVAELRAFCGDLLEAGLAPANAQAARDRGGAATFSGMLRRIDAVAAIVPQLLENLDTDESAEHIECVRAATPLRATLPRRPHDWQPADTPARTPRLLPRHWDRFLPRLTYDTRPLGFVLYVVERLTEDFHVAQAKLLRHIADARLARGSRSLFGRQDIEALADLARALEGGSAALARLRQLLQRHGGGRRLVADPELSRPFPRQPAWAAFRRLADAILRPHGDLGALLGDLLDGASPVADLPFLYQRWVGVRIVQELQRTFGFQVVGDPTGALFLGGLVQLRRGATALQLWCEPRLSRGDHPSGLFATSHDPVHGDATPDYVFVTPGRGGPDAFVLDATMSQDPTLIERKTRYRERIAFREFRPEAGVPGRRLPARAWAAVPIAGATHNHLSRPDGSAGTVPMQPDRFEPGPLQAWLADLVDHAEAWRLLADARAGAGAEPSGAPRDRV